MSNGEATDQGEPLPEPSKPFPARRYLTKISGRDYLEVKWRLLWLRTEHPTANISTELLRDDGASATFKAYVILPNGGTATGHGQESSQDFGDYLEKAETKAIGRALAALGFGTQFCYDFDLDVSGGRVVDSPIDQARVQTSAAGLPVAVLTADPATDRQIKALFAIARAVTKGQGVDVDVYVHRLVKKHYDHDHVDQLSRRECSSLIDLVKDEGIKERGLLPTKGEATAVAIDWTAHWSRARAQGWEQPVLNAVATILHQQPLTKLAPEQVEEVFSLCEWPYKDARKVVQECFNAQIPGLLEPQIRLFIELVRGRAEIGEKDGTPIIAPTTPL